MGAAGAFYALPTPKKSEASLNVRRPRPKAAFPRVFIDWRAGRASGGNGKGGHSTPTPSRQGSHTRQAGRARRHTRPGADSCGLAAGWAAGGRGGGIPPTFHIYARRGAAKGRNLYSAAKAAGYRAQGGAAWRNRANNLTDKTDQRSESLGAARKRLLPGDWSPGTERSD